MGDVEVHALRDVELTIYRSEFVVLLGPSGSGKSTLLNILGGLDVPTSGEARFADHQLWCKRSQMPCAARYANERAADPAAFTPVSALGVQEWRAPMHVDTTSLPRSRA